MNAGSAAETEDIASLGNPDTLLAGLLQVCGTDRMAAGVGPDGEAVISIALPFSTLDKPFCRAILAARPTINIFGSDGNLVECAHLGTRFFRAIVPDAVQFIFAPSPAYRLNMVPAVKGGSLLRQVMGAQIDLSAGRFRFSNVQYDRSSPPLRIA